MSIYDTDYYKKSKKEEDKRAEEDIAQKAKDAEERKAQINATLDQSAAAQTGVYEQAIADAPLQSRALYDQNALDEAVNRKKIQETLANMGMTDSGLSSSMHTALTVQKSRADNQVRANEYQTVRAYESAIDQILADTEAQKASAAIEIDQGVADYKIERKAQAETNATNTATSLYNAELEAYTAQQKQLQANQDSRAKMAQSFIAKGTSINEAWAQAYKAYPDLTTSEGVRYAYYGQLRENGYPTAYANAMSQAYVNTIAANGTAEQASEAVSEALKEKANQLALERVGGRYPAAGSNDAKGVEKTMSDSMALVAQAALSDAERMETVAYMVGMAYRDTILKSTDTAIYQKIGEALEANLSGVYLEIALACAGLQ